MSLQHIIDRYTVKGNGLQTALEPIAKVLPLTPDAAPILSIGKTIREGRLVVGPDLAERVLKEADYAGQRKTYDHHVTLLADLMRRGKWTPGSQIAFAQVGDDLFLVNGRHRMHAVMASQRDIEFQALVVPCADMAEVARLYYHFDVATRVRGTSDVLNAIGVAETFGLSRGMTKAVYSAVGLIGNGLIMPSYLRDPVKVRSVDHRLDAAKSWWQYAVQYEDITDAADHNLRKRLHRPGSVAVALVTLKYQNARATEFWSGVAGNDGLRRGDPRHALITDFMNRSVKTGSMAQTVIVPCSAWNAWFDGKTLGHIKVVGSPIPKLLGTPFDGRKR